MQEILLTTDDVAHYLKVDKFTIYRLVIRKKIPAFKVGNQWRFKKKMIDAWLMKNSNLQKIPITG
jgi:excisionase family DNA binding protein